MKQINHRGQTLLSLLTPVQNTVISPAGSTSVRVTFNVIDPDTLHRKVSRASRFACIFGETTE